MNETVRKSSNFNENTLNSKENIQNSMKIFKFKRKPSNFKQKCCKLNENLHISTKYSLKMKENQQFACNIFSMNNRKATILTNTFNIQITSS